MLRKQSNNNIINILQDTIRKYNIYPQITNKCQFVLDQFNKFKPLNPSQQPINQIRQLTPSNPSILNLKNKGTFDKLINTQTLN